MQFLTASYQSHEALNSSKYNRKLRILRHSKVDQIVNVINYSVIISENDMNTKMHFERKMKSIFNAKDNGTYSNHHASNLPLDKSIYLYQHSAFVK
jgi:hypothetical protein